MSHKEKRLTVAERKRKILKQAFKEGRGPEVHEKMQSLHWNSVNGYQGDSAVLTDLAREWTRQINETLPKQGLFSTLSSSSQAHLTAEGAAPGALLN